MCAKHGQPIFTTMHVCQHGLVINAAKHAKNGRAIYAAMYAKESMPIVSPGMPT